MDCESWTGDVKSDRRLGLNRPTSCSQTGEASGCVENKRPALLKHPKTGAPLLVELQLQSLAAVAVLERHSNRPVSLRDMEPTH